MKRMLAVLYIVVSVNAANGMNNAEQAAEAQLHANNIVKAIKTVLADKSKNSESRDIFEVWRQAAQGMSSQDKEWCGACIQLCGAVYADFASGKILDKTPPDDDERIPTLGYTCFLPFMEAVSGNFSDKLRITDAMTLDVMKESTKVISVTLLPVIKKFADILEESEAQS
jgi:hypothetical protein